MKKIKGIFLFLLAVFLGAALAVHAQDSEASAEPAKETAPSEKKAPVKKKSPAKKKPKKSTVKPVSEYRFNQIDSVPAYKFDKQTNPIIKTSGRKGKTSKKTVPNKKPAADQPIQKLKPAPPISGGQTPKGGAKQNQEQPQEQVGE